MSERRPITIVQSKWPVVSLASWFSGEHDCQANEKAYLRVRQHEDGRRIVYGDRDRGPGGMPAGYRGSHAGYLIPAGTDDAPTINAIRRVAGVIGLHDLGDECIADLPAEEI
jgi:hypothetical protein